MFKQFYSKTDKPSSTLIYITRPYLSYTTLTWEQQLVVFCLIQKQFI